MLVALVVDGAGQADFTSLCWDGEETTGIDEKAVTDWFLLEGHGRCDQEAREEGETYAIRFETPGLAGESRIYIYLHGYIFCVCVWVVTGNLNCKTREAFALGSALRLHCVLRRALFVYVEGALINLAPVASAEPYQESRSGKHMWCLTATQCKALLLARC